MLRKHIKFLTAASIDLSWVNHHLQKNKSGLETASSLCPVSYTHLDVYKRQLHRRSGCRAVPYGVFKNSKGEYVPFDENLTTEELKKVFELN